MIEAISKLFTPKKIITFRVIDHTGDSVMTIPGIKKANQELQSWLHTHVAYDADTQTLIGSIGEDTREVILHRKLVGG